MKCRAVGPHVLDVVLAVRKHARKSETVRGREEIEGNVHRQKNDNEIGREIEKLSGVGIM